MNETRSAKNSIPYIIVEQFRAYFLFGNGLISQDLFVNIFANFVVLPQPVFCGYSWSAQCRAI